MPKMIDGTLLREELHRAAEEKGSFDEEVFTLTEVEDLINAQPKTGYERVTRCKDCMEYIGATGRCRRWGVYVKDDNNFCMYGLFLKGYRKY